MGIDTSYDGIEIIDAIMRSEKVLSFIRKGRNEMLVCVFTLAPVERKWLIGLILLQVFTKKFGNTELEEWGSERAQQQFRLAIYGRLWADFWPPWPAMGSKYLEDQASLETS